MAIGDLIPWTKRRLTPARTGGDPFRALQRQIDDLFQNFLSGSPWDMPSIFAEDGGTFVPRVNIHESDSEIEVTAELPGLTQDQINLNLTDDALILSGEKREEREEKGDKSRRYIERSYGSFQRVIPLSAEVDHDKIDATFKSGVLTVKLQKSQSAQKSKKVTIRSA
ncbi:MAG: Hsp20/alpha crystallin family protein [Deltaproteobacteria bacterium]|nr:Hsp20/alpha crystallin family protein [Deltaproteobacteria bacterium]